MLSLHRFVRKIAMVVALVLAMVPSVGVTYAWACQENAMLVFDASGSMASIRNGLSKIMVARDAAAEILPDVTRRRPTGLVTYGGERGPSCGDVHLKIPPVVGSGELILGELSMMEPKGQTPLSEAVMLAAQTLKGFGQPGVVVLVTDGLENCGYNACALGQKLQREAPNIRVHVIGFHLRSSSESRVACLSNATGGTYTSTNSLETLRDALQKTLSCARISSLPLGRLVQPGAVTVARLAAK